MAAVKERWAVRYPRSGIHTCPYGERQAQMIWCLALYEGINAAVVVDRGEGWEEVLS